MGSKTGRERAYSANDITVLAWHEAVRRRPMMYIEESERDEWTQCLVQETLCHGIEALLQNAATYILVEQLAAGRFRVTHDGPGWDGSPQGPEGSEIHYALTGLHYGCCALNRVAWVQENLCKGSMACVNALSSSFVVTSALDGVAWRVGFERGVETSALAQVDPPMSQGLVLEYTLDADLVPVREVEPTEFKGWWQSLPVGLDPQALRFTS